MLNRRNLRIKAVQSVYAYREKVQSNYELAIDNLKEAFKVDFSMEEPDYEGLEKEAQEQADAERAAEELLAQQEAETERLKAEKKAKEKPISKYMDKTIANWRFKDSSTIKYFFLKISLF